MNEQLTKRVLAAKPWMLFVFAFTIALAPPVPLVTRIWISVWVIIFTWWTLALGQALQRRMADPRMLNEQLFKYFVGFAALYTVIIFWTTDGGYHINSNNADEYGWKLWIILPLHLFVMFCMFYGIYFLSKAIKTIRQSRGHRDESTFLYMLGFWFFPIGIWIIQPRIIEILNSVPTTSSDPHSA